MKLPTIWRVEKQSREVESEHEKQRREVESEERTYKRAKVRRKKIHTDSHARNVRKVAKRCVFPMICGSLGRKVGSLKRRVQSHVFRGDMKNCTPLWREARFQVKMYKTHHSRTTFGSWDVEKLHAAVVRNAFQSQNVQNTPFSDHFWKLGCGKIARRCGEKRISKSKCTKHTILGPLFEVGVWKNCTPLWRETHFKVKMYKTHHSRTTF